MFVVLCIQTIQQMLTYQVMDIWFHNLHNGLHLVHDCCYRQQVWNTMVYCLQLNPRCTCCKRCHYVGTERYKAYWHLVRSLYSIHLELDLLQNKCYDIKSNYFIFGNLCHPTVIFIWCQLTRKWTFGSTISIMASTWYMIVVIINKCGTPWLIFISWF